LEAVEKDKAKAEGAIDKRNVSHKLLLDSHMKKESEFKLKTVLKIQEDFEKEAEAHRVDEEVIRTLDAVHKEDAEKV
jgi:CRISPR/Cas system CSM-associated protein Csm3 (group 7 of RAMP superfamily)